VSRRELHAPLGYEATWTGRMKSTKEEADGMQKKDASLNLMEFRYYGCSNNSNNSVINYYHFAGGFHHSHS
jgi:hypothetical protein